jgi:hypothetical protein
VIEVKITCKGSDLGLVRISNIDMNKDGTADYVVEIIVERGDSIGIHNRVIHSFPRSEYNVLGLLKQALETLSEEEFRFSGDFHTKSLHKQLPHWFGG